MLKCVCFCVKATDDIRARPAEIADSPEITRSEMRARSKGFGAGRLLLLCMTLVVMTTAAPIPTPRTSDPETTGQATAPPVKVLKFMQQFGYLERGDADSEALFSEEAVTEAIRTMQKFGALEQTGVLDNDTLQLLEAPRCGVPDVIREDWRVKRFVIGSEGWRKRHLTYFMANWSPKLGGHDSTLQELQRALAVWSGYGLLHFQPVNTPNADIILAFGRGWHGDSYSFDGPGNILAHAYFPYEFGHYGGDVHFDEDENWMLQPKDVYEGVDLFTVATHELGHSLGLSHSPVAASVMFPYYKGYEPSFVLDYDDILGMYELYIARQLEEDKYGSKAVGNEGENGGDDSQPEKGDEEDQSDKGDEDHSDDRNEEDQSDKSEEDQSDKSSEEDQSDESDEDQSDMSDEEEDQTDESNGDDESDESSDEEGDESDEDSGQEKQEGEDSDDDYDTEKKEHHHDNDDEAATANDEPRTEADERTGAGYEGDYETVDEHKNHDKPGVSGGDDPKQDHPQPPTDHPAPAPAQPSQSALCQGNFDALAVLRGELFIFKGKFLWRLLERGVVEAGYPALFRQMFWDFPDDVQHVDAVYQRPADGNIVFFSGSQYWVSNGDQFVEGSPHPLTHLGLPSGLSRVDAAHVWGKNGKTYFFSKNLYWRYNETAGMDQGYPQDISRWRGIPRDLDASFKWTDGNTYFFKGKWYWRFNDHYIQTDEQYPQPAPQFWGGCPEED